MSKEAAPNALALRRDSERSRSTRPRLDGTKIDGALILLARLLARQTAREQVLIHPDLAAVEMLNSQPETEI